MMKLGHHFQSPSSSVTESTCVIESAARALHEASQNDLLIASQTLARAALEKESISQQLWIVERGRIRIYRPDS